MRVRLDFAKRQNGFHLRHSHVAHAYFFHVSLFLQRFHLAPYRREFVRKKRSAVFVTARDVATFCVEIREGPVQEIYVEIAHFKVFNAFQTALRNLARAVHIVPDLAHHDDVFALYFPACESARKHVAYIGFVTVHRSAIKQPETRLEREFHRVRYGLLVVLVGSEGPHTYSRKLHISPFEVVSFRLQLYFYPL